MNYWLMKTEPTTFSIDNLAKQGTTHWEGVRNYQARNFMRDRMTIGDTVFIYHSNCDIPGIYGLGKITSRPYPDHFAWDPKSKYYDPKSTPETPRWVMVDVQFVQKFHQPLSLTAIKQTPELNTMLVTQRGSRLSIQPVTSTEAQILLNRLTK